jgi:Glycosyl hydrolases family 43
VSVDEGAPPAVDAEGAPPAVDVEGALVAEVDEGPPAEVEAEGPPAEVDEGPPAEVEAEGPPAEVEAEGPHVAVAVDGVPGGVDAAESVGPRRARWHLLARGPRDVGRRRPRARVVALVGVLVIAALVGSRYRAAKADLADTRARLAEVRADLASEQDAITLAGRRAELTQASIDQIRADIEDEVAGRTWLQAITASTLTEIAVVEEDRAETDAARLLVAANSNDALACFAGVSAAVGASRRGDDAASVAALRGGADQCSRTLAYATGARFPYDFADPFVLRAGDTYYAYSTNAGAGDIQVISSTDLVSWRLVGNALGGLPFWASPGATWAPSVLARDGGYVVYYTVRDAASGRQCISRAVASSPTGPFLDDSWGPMVCQRELGGSIDPSPFVDGDGRAYLLWKAESAGGPAQTLWSQELTADGRGVTGPAWPLLSADRAFEHGVVEAPSMVREGGTYVLAYAAADWNSRRYATAYATCAGPAGPCTKPADGRALVSGTRLAGPGGVELFRSRDGALWAAFHAFSEPNVSYPSSRYFHVARARVEGGRLVIDAET